MLQYIPVHTIMVCCLIVHRHLNATDHLMTMVCGMLNRLRIIVTPIASAGSGRRTMSASLSSPLLGLDAQDPDVVHAVHVLKVSTRSHSRSELSRPYSVDYDDPNRALYRTRY